MKEGYRLLGDFIQPIDERNKELKVDYLLGVSARQTTLNRCLCGFPDSFGDGFLSWHRNKRSVPYFLFRKQRIPVH